MTRNHSDPAGRAREMESVDFGSTAVDYATCRAGFPDSFFDMLEQRGVRIKGTRAIDLGTGTGTLARALFVRGASTVIGVDPAEAMTREALALDRAAGAHVEYVHARAESTGLPPRCADLVIAGQSWWWFKADAAAREARRLLAPGGHLVVASLDWLPLPGSVPEATEQLIRRANPRWTLHGGTGRHPRWIADLGRAGFSRTSVVEYDFDLAYTADTWRGRIRASAGVGATLDTREVREFDQAHARLLAERFPDDPLLVPHRIYAVMATAPPGGDAGLP